MLLIKNLSNKVYPKNILPTEVITNQAIKKILKAKIFILCSGIAFLYNETMSNLSTNLNVAFFKYI